MLTEEAIFYIRKKKEGLFNKYKNGKDCIF